MQRCLNCGQSRESDSCEHCGWATPKQRGFFQTMFSPSKEKTRTEVAVSSKEDRAKYDRLEKRSSLRYLTLRAFVPVVATYLLTIVSFQLWGNTSWDETKSIDVGTALLFTLSHGVLPVFLYRAFGKLKPTNPFAYISVPHMAIWFGAPIAVLASMTGWLSLIGPIIHLLLAKRGERAWVFIEYGSTSMALLMFLLTFSTEAMFPMGIFVAFGQAILLDIVGTLGRGLWVDELAQDKTQRIEKSPKATLKHVKGALTAGIVVGLVPCVFFIAIGTVAAAMTREWTPLMFFGGAGIALGAFGGVTTFFPALVAFRNFPDSENALFEFGTQPLQEFTEYVNGELSCSSNTKLPFVGKLPGFLESIHFTCDGTDSRLVWIKGKNPRLQFVFTLEEPTSFRGEIRAAHAGTQIASSLGVLRDVRIGSQPFDDHFIVSCNDTTTAKQIVTSPVQDAMLQLKLWASDQDFQRTNLKLTIRDEAVYIGIGQYLRKTEDFVKFYEESKRAFLALREQLNQSNATATS